MIWHALNALSDPLKAEGETRTFIPLEKNPDVNLWLFPNYEDDGLIHRCASPIESGVL
jgi:hypothetical protein